MRIAEPHPSRTRLTTTSGYLRAADRLKRSWLGTSPGAEPDRLPFARNVKKHALIELVQDGLFLDQLEATAKNVRHAFIKPFNGTTNHE